MKKIKLLVILGLLNLVMYSSAYSQLVIDATQSYNPNKLVRECFQGTGILIINVRSLPSIGYFNGKNSNIGMEKGLILSTGSIWGAVGPNKYYNLTSNSINTEGDADLNKVTQAKTFDAACLEIDFIPLSNELSFKFVFASEEYQEYVFSKFNDAFAFFVSKKDSSKKINIAKIPGTTDIVSINTVNNGCVNPLEDTINYCIDVTNNTPRNPGYFVDNTSGSTVEYDGFTKVMTAYYNGLVPGETYTLKIVIADVADDRFDSAVFLMAESFSSDYTLQYSPSCMNDTTYFSSEITKNASSSYWDFGDGDSLCFFSSNSVPKHVYKAPGDYKVKMVVSFLGGLVKDTITETITVSEPIADFSFSADPDNQNLYSFTNTSIVNNGVIVYKKWYFGDGFESNSENPYHRYDKGGFYDVMLIITTKTGCADTIIKTLKYYQLSNSSNCINSPIVFGLAPGMEDSEYEWNFGDSYKSSEKQPVHYYSSSGTFPVSLIVTGKNGVSKDTFSTKIEIYGVSADFEYLKNKEQYLKVSFEDKSKPEGDGIEKWIWDFGDGKKTTESNPVHVYNNTGLYKVKLIVFGERGCSDTVVKYIKVSVPTNAIIAQDECAGIAGNFDIETIWNKITSCKWDFGDGSASNQISVQHAYEKGGEYIVKAVITNDSSQTVTLDTTVRIDQVIVNFNYQNDNNTGLLINFYDKSTSLYSDIIHWFWDFGDGEKSNEQNPIHKYSNFGTYNIVFIATNENGCRDTIFSKLDLNPEKNKISVFEECAGIPCNFNIDSKWTITSCHWDFGDSSTSDKVSDLHAYEKGGEYPVKVMFVNDKSVSDSLGVLLKIDQATAGFAYKKEKSYSLETEFTDQSSSLFSNIIAWFWDFGDANKSNKQSPVHVYTDNKLKKVIQIVTNENGCQDTIVKLLNRIEISQNCAGFVSGFNYNTGWKNSSCEWDFGDGAVSAETSPEHIYSNGGEYKVRAIIKNLDNNELDTITENINIISAVADFEYKAVSGVFKYRFNDKSTSNYEPITGWNWDFGDGNSGTEQNPEHEYSDYGVYKVVLVITTDYGCKYTAFTTINNFGKASSLVTLPDTCLNTGDTLLLPLILESESYLKANKNFEFEAVIRFNKSLLLPLPGNDFQYVFDDKDCIATIKGNRNAQLADFHGQKVLAWLKLFVLLGNSEEIEIRIDSFKWSDGYEADVSTRNSRFCVLDLCKAGGKRLYYGSGTVALMQPRPNPADEVVEIEYEVVADGNTELFISDLSGNRVAGIINSIIAPGRYSILFDTSELASGVYYITLKTRSETITQFLKIVK